MKTLLSIITLGLLLACNPEYSRQEDTTSVPRPVTVERTVPTDQPIPIVSSGILGSKTELTRSFKIGGIVEHMFVEEGTRVKKGQTLARLNQSEISAQVSQARLAAEKTSRDLQRAENLYRDSVITLEQLQDLRTLKEVASADLEIAEFNKNYATIIAEADGKILKKFTEAGELVQPGTPIYQLAYTHQDAHVMRIGVADRDVVRLAYQDSADVEFDAYPNTVFRAYVSEIAESADPGSYTFEIELTLKSSDYPLKNGFVGKVSLYPSGQPTYYRISMDALVEGEERVAKIFVMDEQTQRVSLQQVIPEFIGDGFFTVSASSFGEPKWVVTEGSSYLRPNQEVQINQP